LGGLREAGIGGGAGLEGLEDGRKEREKNDNRGQGQQAVIKKSTGEVNEEEESSLGPRR
jgi:hypothetical protein